MIKFAIHNRWTGAVQFEAEIDVDQDAGVGIKVGLAVKWARDNSAVLRGADLRGADLRSFKADMWATLTENRAEVSGLIKALREGRINGSQYTGSCACLVGTIANVKGVDYSALTHSPDNPAERWFMMIREGDKPGDDTAGGFAASKALEWALEYCALTGIAVPEPEAA